MERLFNGVSRQMSFAAATADYIGTDAIEVPVFEKTILDNTKKRGVLMQRVPVKAATGHPTRYFEKVAHDSKHKFIDPRKIDHSLDTAIDFVEHSAYIKGLVDGITFTKFDREVYQQQGSMFGDLTAQALDEMVTDMLDAQDRAVWTGTAKDLMDSTNPEYCSILTQVKKTGVIAKGVRLTKGIIQNVAELMYNKQYAVKPTAIYMNPLDKALLDEQEMDEKDKVKIYDVNILPGIKINGIMTAAGILPIITDIYCPVGKILITDEKQLERRYVASAAPRVYQLGTEKDLCQRFIAVLFDTFIVKAGEYGHKVVTIEGRTEETVTPAQNAAAGN